MRSALGRPVRVIDLADYKSMDDEVTFDDLAAAMNVAWKDHRLPTGRRSVDVIVHSTGALVIRDWLARNFTVNAAPVYRLVMLAPANFGSPLAHKGRSLLGRIVKGWNSDKPFQTGTKILKGLELASPYSWDLAMRDRFGPRNFYRTGKVLTTVLVGNTGYSGISSVANEDGSDGTVRVSTANLNAAHVLADFATDPHNPRFLRMRQRTDVAFAVMNGENHSTIALKGKSANRATLPTIFAALGATDRNYAAFRKTLAERTAGAMAAGRGENSTHGFQNTLFRVRDDFGTPVRDYFLEFYVEDDDTGWFEELFHRNAIRKVHPHSDDPSLRSVYVDCTQLFRDVNLETEGLKLSLTAMPEFRSNGNVGYRTFSDKDIGGIHLPRRILTKLFRQNRTVLIDLTIRRQQSKKVFRFKRLGK